MWLFNIRTVKWSEWPTRVVVRSAIGRALDILSSLESNTIVSMQSLACIQCVLAREVCAKADRPEDLHLEREAWKCCRNLINYSHRKWETNIIKANWIQVAKSISVWLFRWETHILSLNVWIWTPDSGGLNWRDLILKPFWSHWRWEFLSWNFQDWLLASMRSQSIEGSIKPRN